MLQPYLDCKRLQPVPGKEGTRRKPDQTIEISNSGEGKFLKDLERTPNTSYTKKKTELPPHSFDCWHHSFFSLCPLTVSLPTPSLTSSFLPFPSHCMSELVGVGVRARPYRSLPLHSFLESSFWIQQKAGAVGEER